MMEIPQVGAHVRMAKAQLDALIRQLDRMGYRVIGPRVRDAAIVLDDVSSWEDLPAGWLDEQDGGYYRLKRAPEAGLFDHVVGPHSLKQFLLPAREVVLEVTRGERGWSYHEPPVDDMPCAILGLRGCDIHALRIQDRVFLEGPYVDTRYAHRRQSLFIVAVNCRRAAPTCFCHSMDTGPNVSSGFDLALYEGEDSFVVEIGTESGRGALEGVAWTACEGNEVETMQQATVQLRAAMESRPPMTVRSTMDPSSSVSRGTGQHVAAPTELTSQGLPSPSLERAPAPLRSLDTAGLHDLLLDNLDHSRWSQVAERCLACGNCTMVCPTCFCCSVEEVPDLLGTNVERTRSWASCFTQEHSYMSSGVVRNSTRSRYRQWLTHKLATWIDQFGTSGCVGCGRCITWCPVGIDLTEEVAALRGGPA